MTIGLKQAALLLAGLTATSAQADVRDLFSAVRLSSSRHVTGLSSTPAPAQINKLFNAIRLSGSERLMVHTLSLPGMPRDAVQAREQLLTRMGYRGAPGTIGDSGLSFSPVMTHDGNVNGGFASDTLVVAGIPFTLGEEYKAVGGLLLGVSGSGRMRMAVAENTALDVRYGGVVSYAPEHDMAKISLGGEACLRRMHSFSTYSHACVDTTLQRYELGESNRFGAKLGVTHAFTAAGGVHEVSADLMVNRYLNATDYSQPVASVSLTSALPVPAVISAGVQVGGSAGDNMVMREKLNLGLGFLAWERPTSISVSLQNNRGSQFLGEALESRVTTIGASHQFNEKLTVSASVSITDSSAAFFDDTAYGFSANWRF
ncbi:hypothetical protein [Defluviimonas salinarum]|uniref:Autotransporter outer membrane beta-barrel domain-containing protein n=1 Tax=Defluviimonas salinarum TaxID=2992147 RepID=A0ABT3J4F2_9RHOB|nr:hypothetical protein [Defluviimonas salinarum]MCW3782543.1 hypothetical protein [Defluviimonas salinarum]